MAFGTTTGALQWYQLNLEGGLKGLKIERSKRVVKRKGVPLRRRENKNKRQNGENLGNEKFLPFAW